MAVRPLAGRRVVTTRDERGRLDSLLAVAGADVVHVPLISIQPATGPDLAEAMSSIGDFDWLIVTSRHGAERVGDAAAAHPELRLAAVGTRTAAVLEASAGRPIDVVPERQTAADLARAMAGRTGRALVAQADRADPGLVEALRAGGLDVRAVTAYRTDLRTPTWRERAAVAGADAVGFASGSATEAWADAIGTATPPVAAAIGPSTAEVAARRGLQITHVAADHDVDGLAAVIADALVARP